MLLRLATDAEMENSSLSSDVWNDVTPFSSNCDTSYLANIRDFALKVVYIIIGTVGVIDNLFVLIVFCLFIKITNKTMNILIVNQSIIDMCASFLTLLTALVEVNGSHMSNDSICDQFVCRFWLTRVLLWSFLVTSTYGILFIALERYVAVVYPVWYQQKLKKRMLLYIPIMSTIWFIIATYEATTAYFSTDIINGVCIPYGVYSSVVAEKLMAFCILFLGYLLPLVLMIFFYSRIVYKLHTQTGVVASSRTCAASRNAVVTSLLICCGFIICWSLCEIFFFVNTIHHVIDFSGWLYHFSVVLVLTNSCINPFIYAAMYRDFRNAFRRLLDQQVCSWKQTNHATDPSGR